MFQTVSQRTFVFVVLFCQVRKPLSAFYPRVYQNTVISRGIFSVRFDVDWLSCIEDCMRKKDCFSYNYGLLGVQNHTCELSRCASTTTDDCSKKYLRFSQGFVYQQLKEKPDKDLDSCEVRSEPAKPSSPTYYKDCAEIMRSGQEADGLYIIDPDGRGSFSVQCDQKTDGGGWIVIQKRFDGKQDFRLFWKDYADGFGSLGGEFWLGLDRVHRLTDMGNSVLRIELKNKKGDEAYSVYENFFISNKETMYKLNATFSSGTAGDSLKKHTGHLFSTKDQDNDLCTDCSCAERFSSAWWYDGLQGSCLDSDLNGPYNSGITWSKWLYQIKSTVMKIRPDNI